MSSTNSQKEIASYGGLSDAEVQESRNLHGENVLTPPARTSVFVKFLKKFTDPLIIILLVAGTLSVGISFYEYFGPGAHHGDESVFFEPIGIFVAIFLATGLAFYFEQKADKEFDLLNQVNDDTAVQVWRNGYMTEVPKRDIVVGDVVVLTTGNEVPADGELLEAVSLHIDESTLTGEPLCEKTTDPALFDTQATYPSNHVLRGTKVMEGHGVFRVLAVGDATESGAAFVSAQIDNGVKTPLNEQLEGLAARISTLSYALAALIVIGRTMVFFLNAPAFDWVEFFASFLQTCMVAVTLIVVAVPEGLPMAVTLSLAYSMRRMLKSNNLVRKMHACETMGATTVICTDKTGTLTQNQMRVAEPQFFSLSGKGLGEDILSRTIIEGIAVNSTATLDLTDPSAPRVLGNPTEGALVLWLYGQGIHVEDIRRSVEVLEELPFTTERKYMATVVRSSVTGKRTLYVKGAPEIVFGLSSRVSDNRTAEEVNRVLVGYQTQAMRTLGFAFRTFEDDDAEMPIRENRVCASSLEFLGIVAISDPVRADVPKAVQECLSAGIRIKIVTGDTIPTACEIGRQIGLVTPEDNERNFITGPEFAALSDAELEERILDLKIIARARPMDKKRLVETLQKKGQVVAVTGDGTNDAPALKAAHVGLSMGDGTSVAKEASDITILDNSFTSITRSVMWGRSLYLNIQRFILFQMTVNVAACLIVLIGAFLGTQSPITVTQMLWVNLIMDTFAGLALASLPPSESVMNKAPRSRNDFIITRKMWRGILGTGVFFTALLLVLLSIFRSYNITSLTDLLNLGNPETSADAGHLTLYEISLFFTIFVMLQFWNMFNARAYATRSSAFHLKGCKGFLSIVLFILVGQVLIVSFGGVMFSVTPLSLVDWLIIIPATSLVLWFGELRRLWRKK